MTLPDELDGEDLELFLKEWRLSGGNVDECGASTWCLTHGDPHTLHFYQVEDHRWRLYSYRLREDGWTRLEA
jgi:hypothetical protein